MSNVTPAGPESVAIAAIQTLLSNLPFFWTWTSSNSAAEAAQSIWYADTGYAVETYALANNVLTITTTRPHNLTTSNVVQMVGAASGADSFLNINGNLNMSISSVTANTVTCPVASSATTYGPVPAPRFCMLIPNGRPIAIIRDVDDAGTGVAVASNGASVIQGAAEIYLEADVSAGYRNDPANSYLEAKNAVGQIWQQLIETQGTLDYVCLNEVKKLFGPKFIPSDQQTSGANTYETWGALLRCTWGLGG